MFQIIEDVFETREVLRRGFAERFVRMEHIGVDLLFLFRRRSVGLVTLEQLALRSSIAVAVNVENLIEPEAHQQISAALATMNDVQMSVP